MNGLGRRLARLEAAAEARNLAELVAYLESVSDDELLRLAEAGQLPPRLQEAYAEASALSDEQLLAVLQAGQ